MALYSRCPGTRNSRLIALVLAALMVAAPVGASATVEETTDSLTDTVEETANTTTKTVEDTTQSVTGDSTGSSPVGGSTTSAPTTLSSDGSVSTSGTSATASGSTVEARLGGHEVLTVGQTKAKTHKDGSASSDATVLSLLGLEIVGAHSRARGGDSSAQTGVLLHALCGMSSGSLCVSLLYGYASSSDDGTRSSSEAYTNVAGACAGGDQDAPHEECDGPVDVTVAESRSSAQSNRATGDTSAQRSSTLAAACLGGRDADGTCEGIGATVLHAESEDGGDESAQGLTVEGGGEAHDVLPHPGALPPGDCADDGSCVGLNDGDTALGAAGTPAAPGSSDSDGRWASASAEGGVLRVSIGGQELLRASSTSAETKRDHSASSDATVLAVLGHELIGAHATAHNGSSEAETGYLTETCEASDGALCVALLYGRAAAEDNASSSSAESDTALVSACAGGDRQDPTDSCDDGINAEVGTSHSDASQDKDAGSSQANQVSDGAVVCAGGEDAQTGDCSGIGVTVLHAESHSSASPDGNDGSSDSSIATVEAGGEEQIALDQEGDIAVPPGCPSGQSLVCITLNSHTDADAGDGSGGGSGDGATAIDIQVLPDDSGEGAGDGQAAWAGTDADAGGGEKVAVLDADPIERDATDPRRDPASPSRTFARPATVPADAGSSGLAQTGMHLLGWLLLAGVSLTAGVTAVRRTRRA